MSYASKAPLKVRYGTAAEPWHSLSQWYHADTPLPIHRDYTSRARRYTPQWTSLGQTIYGFGPGAWGPVVGAFAAGALTMHLMHRFHVLGMNRRPRRNRRRR